MKFYAETRKAPLGWHFRIRQQGINIVGGPYGPFWRPTLKWAISAGTRACSRLSLEQSQSWSAAPEGEKS